MDKNLCTKHLLEDLGLQHHLEEKLTLSTLLEVKDKNLKDKTITSLKSLPWCFLRKLMRMNVTARSVKCTANQEPTSQDLDSLFDDDSLDGENELNPLDLITALFLCSDGFLQQEMASKMSMCQFSVPLLLPSCDTQKPTLMLWALRDIVKKFRPHSLQDSKGLGNSSLSKSHILNQILSNPQQYHDTFVHRNMTGGNTPKRISEGLVEISWYLPCGNENIDIFPEAVAVANLRGDASAFETQFSFLCQTSTAVFVFCDDFQTSWEILNPKNINTQLFLVCNSENRSFNKQAFKEQVVRLQVPASRIILKTQKVNDAEFAKKLRVAMPDVIKEHQINMSVEKMCAIAHEFGIPVDEGHVPCQNAKQNADAITAGIANILKYKQSQLPLQGKIWKELSKLEKEECRLRHAGDTNIEQYKSDICKQKQRLKEQQKDHCMSDAMSHFISALSGPREERSYFLKWMKINLDHLSLRLLSDLRERYKELCLNSPQNTKLIAEVDRQISSSSLGVEHFLREMGQLYESACSLDKNHPYRKQMQNLPTNCAQLLLDGFPVELIDGDASNIPLQWVKDVLTELHRLTQSNSRIRVITVLGVQSTGKSTLLNAMFGVQFAVSSGRCTRGAFMLLIRVQQDFREQLGCDFIMVIDTEGLKSPELAQLADSYEHDNELATLVVGLSDITVINIAMENATEMKDILQIVVHAFLRMKEVGKKPCCMLVHQNVADVSAHNKNLRDRKLLLEQLDEMTQAAAKMEKRDKQTFRDVMDYDPEKNTWYIPGLWHGTPPMAPVNAGYSETVNEFKSSMIKALKELKEIRPPHTIPEFLEWTSSLWKAVKYENFIFSFQNSLVADAYTRLCSEYNIWNWAFRKDMYSWVIQAENRVSNFSLKDQSDSSLDDLLDSLKMKAYDELDKQQKEITEKVTEYFKRKEGHVYLVEKYRQEFMNSVTSLKTETENSVMMKLKTAVEIKKGMASLDNITENHKSLMEKQVLTLLDSCRKANQQMSEKQLEQEFEKMWKETMEKLSFRGLQRQNVVQEIYSLLRSNLETKGGSVREMLSKASRLDQCGREDFDINKDKNIIKKFIMNYVLQHKKKIQEMSDSIINSSRVFIADKLRTRTDFHKTYVLELLGMIDKQLETQADLGICAEFEASLKIHICGHAAREFQQMHDAFIRDNDPRQCLEKFKQQYCTNFKDLFCDRDQCQRKAEEFTTQCLQPAVREYVTKYLGHNIVEKMQSGDKGSRFSTRSFFQFSILEHLLSEDRFEKFLSYISSYENFVKEWILGQIVEHFSRGDNSIADMEERLMKLITRRIKDVVENVQRKAAEKGEEDMNIRTFIQDMCSNLNETLVFPKHALDAVMVLNKANSKQFSDWLLSLIKDMEQSLSAEFHREQDVRARLTSLPLKPQDELFKQLIGCGKQCPFCKAPCEADYQKLYPDWCIQPDCSIEASAYWKYVFAQFNTQFAEEYGAEAADLPSGWDRLTKQQALQSLEETFRMKR
ncbi:hypothetical protein AAFF_G00361370 [Aldrovandia affinis]|uniref:VLIG-type G domain-containing protein n=1 Tax=Aldrovandia affinis TaxID=143900 RepID=A0AAD7R4Y5_9TELE|nr:hypothetical protein AAFF_G00361370 [Aldrovandia affinis]